jgi:hypothetical protein
MAMEVILRATSSWPYGSVGITARISSGRWKSTLDADADASCLAIAAAGDGLVGWFLVVVAGVGEEYDEWKLKVFLFFSKFFFLDANM